MSLLYIGLTLRFRFVDTPASETVRLDFRQTTLKEIKKLKVNYQYVLHFEALVTRAAVCVINFVFGAGPIAGSAVNFWYKHFNGSSGRSPAKMGNKFLKNKN